MRNYLTRKNAMGTFVRSLGLSLLLVLFCAPLLAHIYLGSYSRFMADDFCSSAIARSRGIIGGTVYWYMNWTGRFSANFLDSLFGYLGAGATPYATGLVVTTWFVVLALALVQIIPASNDRPVRLLLACLVAAMILFAVLEVIPMVGQSLYWGQGMRSVVPPLIIGTALVALIANRSNSRASSKYSAMWFVAAALLAFIAVGFAETYFAVQTSALLIAVVMAGVSNAYAPANKRNYIRLLIAGLTGSLAGGLLMLLAPGNQFRQASFGPHPAPPEVMAIAFRGLRQFFELLVLSPSDSPIEWFVWAGLLLCGFIFGLGIFQPPKESSELSRRYVWMLVWLPVITFLLLLACWLPMAYATSLILAHRTLIIPAYVLVCLFTWWSYLVGRVCRSSYYSLTGRSRKLATMLSLITLIAFGVFTAGVSRKMWRDRSRFAGYARVWDEREALIQSAKSQGLSYAVVYRLHNWAALDEIAVDPKITWLTKCVQDYYGIGVIPDLGDLFGEPNGKAKQTALEQQFDTIHTPAGAVPAELNRIYKTERGKIRFYNSDLRPDEIKTFYETEFARLGWKHVGEKKVEPVPIFRGGTQNLFCNGDIAATLFITGQDEQRLGYTYSLALNWGMSSGFTWGVVDCQPAEQIK